MPFQLEFSHRHKYEFLETGIPLEVILKYGGKEIQSAAKVDPGAQCCLFSREIGELLGIDVASGIRREFATLTGALIAFGHEVTLGTLGELFDTTVYFAEEYELPRNLLGRQGWLQLVRLAIIDYDEELYLSLYNDQT
ncbi:MAG: hypothetical protein ACREAB_04700 [Blastocatellia bacterium]